MCVCVCACVCAPSAREEGRESDLCEYEIGAQMQRAELGEALGVLAAICK